jgi:hypothetical protein
MKKAELTLIAVAIGFVSVFSGLALSSAFEHPLDQLEREVRATAYHQAFYAEPKTNGMAGGLEQLEYAATLVGVHVAYVPLAKLNGSLGVSHRTQRVIAIADNLAADAKFETLAHELAHVLQPDRLLGHAEGEVWAEAVSYLVGLRYGYENRNAHLYIANWKQALHILQIYRQEIIWTASVITAGR